MVKNTPNTTIDTISGRRIDLLNPQPKDMVIADIAAGLSKICRFGGQIKKFYNVALHSLLVAELAPESHKLEALLHDASEAYLGDVISPLKTILGAAYKDIESRFMDAIIVKFRLDRDKLRDIKQYDKEAYALEDQRFRKGEIQHWELKMRRYGLYPLLLMDFNFVEHVFLQTYLREYDKRHGD